MNYTAKMSHHFLSMAGAAGSGKGTSSCAGMASLKLGNWRQWYKNRSSRKIDSQRLFSRE